MRPVCKYDAAGCYQRSEDHLRKYSHPSREKAAESHAPAPAPPPKPAAAPAPAPAGKRSILDLLNATVPKRTVVDMPAAAPKVPGGAIIISDETTSPPRAAGAPSATMPAPAQRAPTPASAGGAGKQIEGPVKRDSVQRRDPPASPPRPPQPRPASAAGSPTKSTLSTIAVPPPRRSPLGGAGATPNDVFEMPHPTEELAAVFAAAQRVNPADPLRAWASRGVVLVGPFEVLAGRAFESDVAKWTAHRAVTDPPEAQAVALDTSKGARICLFRDDPGEQPAMVVASPPSGKPASAKWEVLGTSIAVALANAVDGGSSAETAALVKQFSARAKDGKTAANARRKKTIAPTATGLGIVVPYDRRTELGYREPMIERGKLLRLLDAVNESRLGPKQREELDEQMRFNDISNDECDFGLGLELGHDFLCKLHPAGVLTPVATHADRMLSMAYNLLGRPLFAHVLQCSLSRLKPR